MMCGLPAGNPKLQSPVVMVNLLGDLWEKETPDWSRVFRYPTAKLHLYGKREARPGRKMGHVCCLHENLDTALEMARDVLGEIDPL
jgi:5-(carboxyamino)imidazole ribonucleotide synthase